MEENEYVERLEKIIDNQDKLLTQLDAKFKQQDILNKDLENQNKILREDIQKHKNLLRDMNKTVTQHKNVVKKLKKELEDQLKIQQDLHKEYGEVIRELTEELEGETSNQKTENNNHNSDSDKIELPPKEFKQNYISNATNILKDMTDKSSEFVNDKSKPNQSIKEDSVQQKNNLCPKCGAEISEGHLFCGSCGAKMD